MEHSGIERRASAVARSFGMAVAVVGALLLGMVAAAYARGGEDLAGTPAHFEPSDR
ncbi:MAG TPA: hypothetical protein VM580_05030 [Labilithrix sp.]|jgi:hypothetical protein|nr:hypothetical protein [Labilithrix sp.]